jgi:hypothetical protein
MSEFLINYSYKHNLLVWQMRERQMSEFLINCSLSSGRETKLVRIWLMLKVTSHWALHNTCRPFLVQTYIHHIWTSIYSILSLSLSLRLSNHHVTLSRPLNLWLVRMNSCLAWMWLIWKHDLQASRLDETYLRSGRDLSNTCLLCVL